MTTEFVTMSSPMTTTACTNCSDNERAAAAAEYILKAIRDGITRKLTNLVDSEELDIDSANDVMTYLGLDEIKIAKEYSVTISGTWYTTISVEASSEEEAAELCENVTIDLDVSDLDHEHSMTLDYVDIETTDTEVTEG